MSITGNGAFGNDYAALSNAPYRGDSGFAGLSGGVAGVDKMWISMWDGEVLRAYDEYNAFAPMVRNKTIESGTTAEFPITGIVELKARWAAGEEIIGNVNDHKSDTIAISLDRRPMATYFELDNMDEMLSQWEFRSELSRQSGLQLANTMDRKVSSYILRAACEQLTVGDPRVVAGKLDNAANFVLDSDKYAALGIGTDVAARTGAVLQLLNDIEEFLVRMQEQNIDTMGIRVAVTPRTFQDIRSLGIARDAADLIAGAGRPMFGGVAEAGGLGSPLTMGMNRLQDTLVYQDVLIYKTNHLPVVNYAINTANQVNLAATTIAGGDASPRTTFTHRSIGEDRYNLFGANAGVRALIWKPDCVAALQKLGVKTDSDYDKRRGTSFTISSMLSGCGVLAPECAAVFIDSSVTPIDPGGNGTATVGTYTEGNITRAKLRDALGMQSEYVTTSGATYTANYGADSDGSASAPA